MKNEEWLGLALIGGLAAIAYFFKSSPSSDDSGGGGGGGYGGGGYEIIPEPPMDSGAKLYTLNMAGQTFTGTEKQVLFKAAKIIHEPAKQAFEKKLTYVTKAKQTFRAKKVQSIIQNKQAEFKRKATILRKLGKI